jgi:ribosomal protein S18 acetylase RimI-like enzyme
MSITVRHGENAYWGPHVFLDGHGSAEEVRETYARESAAWHGGLADLDTAMRIDRLIHDAQAAPPSYSSVAFEEGPFRADWEETLAAPDTAYFVAEAASRAVGHTTVYRDPVDKEALHLASTAVEPGARGRGIGVALTTYVLAHAAAEGYLRVRTNWRVTNLGASRFWPARGFRLTHLRLVRRLPDL